MAALLSLRFGRSWIILNMSKSLWIHEKEELIIRTTNEKECEGGINERHAKIC